MLARSAARLSGLSATFPAVRALHSTAVRASVEAAADEDVAPTVQGLVEEGMEVFRKNPAAYLNFDPADINFTVGKDFRNNPCPEMRHRNELLPFGLSHVTPWAVVYYADMGYKGNLGEKIYNSNQIRENPADADYRLGIIMDNRHSGESINQDFADYCKWLSTIDDKLSEHIADNLDVYAKVKAKYMSGPKKDISLIRAMIRSSMSSSVRRKKDETGTDLEGTDYVMAGQRMFYRAKKEVTKFDCQWDQKVYAAEGLVRRKVPIFDAHQKEIPLIETPVRSSNIISAVLSLRPSMFEHYYGMKREVRSITILTQAERQTRDTRQPYAQKKFDGGYQFNA